MFPANKIKRFDREVGLPRSFDLDLWLTNHSELFAVVASLGLWLLDLSGSLIRYCLSFPSLFRVHNDDDDEDGDEDDSANEETKDHFSLERALLIFALVCGILAIIIFWRQNTLGLR